MNKQKITYKQWVAILNRIAEREGYVPFPVRLNFDSTWKPLYEKGLKPRQAWDSVGLVPQM
jgi:hypothetical protein